MKNIYSLNDAKLDLYVDLKGYVVKGKILTLYISKHTNEKLWIQ